MKKTLFNIGHPFALMAAFTLPFIGFMQPAQQASARVMQAGGGMDHTPFLTNFWTDAWGLPFISGDSGMNLEDFGGLPGFWTVQVVEDHHLNYEDMNLTEAEVNAQFVVTGVLEESARISLPGLTPSPQVLADNDIISMNFSIIAGTLVGSTGYNTGVYGLEQTIEIPTGEFDEMVLLNRSFTPFGVTVDANSAATEAGILASDLTIMLGQSSPDAGTAKLPVYESCLEEYDACMSACNWGLAAMLLACVGAGAAAAWKCSKTNCVWLWWFPAAQNACNLVCLGVGALALGACVVAAWAWYKGCKHNCRAALTDCNDDAVREVLEELMNILFPGYSGGNPQPLPPQSG